MLVEWPAGHIAILEIEVAIQADTEFVLLVQTWNFNQLEISQK